MKKQLSRLSRTSMLTGLACLLLAVVASTYVFAKAPNSSRVLDNSKPQPPAGEQWNKVFEENFDGTTYDLEKWATCYDWFEIGQGGCTNSGNEELEWYVPEAVTIENGHATFTASERLSQGWTSSGQPQEFKYVSGMLSTGRSSKNEEPKWTGTYGYYEARIKVPKGKGLWPAFWLLPADRSWPPEIDIMEHLGDKPNEIIMTYFWNDGAYPPPKDTDIYTGEDFTEDWHTFGVNWQPGKIDWYIDGAIRKSVRSENVPSKAMEIIVNLAVGGRLPGSPDDSTEFPAEMLVDYVRVYQLAKNNN